MHAILHEIDALLRGHFTRREELAAGRIDLPALRITRSALLLGATYGLCMGLFALLRGGREGIAQFAATILKVPLLFLLTLVVTFPSLYVSAALGRLRLDGARTLRLLLVAMTVAVALLASLGPVTAFFTLSTDSYPFMVLLNVLVFASAGLVGLGFLRRSLGPLFSSDAPAAAAPVAGSEATARRVFGIWMVLFAVVGSQMGWILRPFIGDPRLPFTFLRPRQSNFVEAVLRAFEQLSG